MVLGIIKGFFKLMLTCTLLCIAAIVIIVCGIRSCTPFSERPSDCGPGDTYYQYTPPSTHSTVSYMIEDYEFCRRLPKDTYISCPVCHRTFQKNVSSFCSTECDAKFWRMRRALEGKRETESYGKVLQ